MVHSSITDIQVALYALQFETCFSHYTLRKYNRTVAILTPIQIQPHILCPLLSFIINLTMKKQQKARQLQRQYTFVNNTIRCPIVT